MEEFTRPSILRLAKKAGVKVMSEDCYDTLRNLIVIKVDEVIKDLVIINNQKGTKTLLIDDIIDTLNFKGIIIGKSNELSTCTITK